MTNTYKATSEYGRAIFGEDVFDGDFTAAEENDHVNGGHLELVPRKYTILSDNFAEGEKGSEWEVALPVDRERALIEGFHIKRVDDDEPDSSDDDSDDSDSGDDKPAKRKRRTTRKTDDDEALDGVAEPGRPASS